MKILIILLGVVLFLSGCKKTILNYGDLAAIEGSVSDITVDEGIDVYAIDLSSVFSVQNENNRKLQYRLQSNSNTSLLTAEIAGDSLILNIHPGQTGSARIALRSETPAVFKDTNFLFTLKELPAQTILSKGRSLFVSGDYRAALPHFKLVTRKGILSLYSQAFMGAGFCKMRLSGLDLGYNDFIQSLGYNDKNYDAIAGLALLEYAQKKNYSEAIRQGMYLLQLEPDYHFTMDSTLDKNDILLNTALSQFSSHLYNDCMTTVQILDAQYAGSAEDPDFVGALSRELEILIARFQ